MEMHNKKENDWERLTNVLEWSNLNPNAFAREIGIPRAENLYQIRKGNNGISRKLASLIAAKYPEIDMAWLLTGEGTMLNSKEIQGTSIPFFNQDVESGIDDIEFTEPTTMLFLPSFVDGDIAMLYKGSAMQGLIPTNSVVVLKKIAQNMIVTGNEYVILTKKVVLLRIVRSNPYSTVPSYVLEAGDRRLFDDTIIAIDDIDSVYRVTSKITCNVDCDPSNGVPRKRPERNEEDAYNDSFEDDYPDDVEWDLD